MSTYVFVVYTVVQKDLQPYLDSVWEDWSLAEEHKNKLRKNGFYHAYIEQYKVIGKERAK